MFENSFIFLSESKIIHMLGELIGRWKCGSTEAVLAYSAYLRLRSLKVVSYSFKDYWMLLNS